jgi:conjugative transfer pilus assembly protein TraH
MFKGKMLRILAILIFFIFCGSEIGSADWISNWYDQMVSTSPEYIKGQQRGYFTLGSFSARTQTESLYPVSIQKPRLNVGCGGIDIFLGGFSFLNLEYLVTLAQRMIQVAPYIAFKIALETISQQLGGIVDQAQQIINLLNSLQFNECSFMEGFMVKTMGAGDVTAGLIEGASRSGLLDFWERAKERMTTGGINDVKAKDMIEGCPGDTQDLLLNLSNQGTIDYVARERGYSDSELIGLIRAAVGDVYVKFDDEGVPKFGYVEPCGDAFSQIESKKKLKIRRSWNGECEDYDLNQFISRVRQDLYSLYSQMVNKGSAVNNPNYQLLNPRKSPLPVYMIIKTAILTGDRYFLESSVEPIAYGYLKAALIDVLSFAHADVERIYNKLSSVEQVKNDESQTQDPTKTCKIPELPKEYAKKLVENRDRAMKSLDVVSRQITDFMNAYLALVERYEAYYRQAVVELSKKFGPFVASRVVMGGM